MRGKGVKLSPRKKKLPSKSPALLELNVFPEKLKQNYRLRPTKLRDIERIEQILPTRSGKGVPVAE